MSRRAGASSLCPLPLRERATGRSGSGGEAYDEALPLKDGPAIAPAFDAATLKSIQRGEIGDAEAK